MAGYNPRLTEGGDSTGELRQFILGDTLTLTLGDAVRLSSGFIALSGQTSRVLGVVLGFVDSAGLPLDAQHVNASDFTLSGRQGSIGSGTVVSASDNTTVAQIQAVVNVSPHQEYFNDADGSLAQAQVGTHYDSLAASDQIDQSTTGATGQWILMSIDPENDGDVSNGIFRISEHALQLG